MAIFGGGAEGCRSVSGTISGPPLGQKFCEAKIEKFHLATVGDENIGWLDVAVNDGLGVGRFKSVCHLVAVFWNALEVYRSPGNPVFQRVPFEKFHDDEVLTIILVHVINRADVRMV